MLNNRRCCKKRANNILRTLEKKKGSIFEEFKIRQKVLTLECNYNSLKICGTLWDNYAYLLSNYSIVQKVMHMYFAKIRAFSGFKTKKYRIFDESEFATKSHDNS